jgi:hypothetical protein
MTSISQLLQTPLNAAQLELLQLFAGGLTDEQIVELRRILLDFKFKRVTALADKFVAEKGWDSEDIAEDAQDIKRTPYRKSQ